MKYLTSKQRAQLESALTILKEETTTLEKFNHLKTLISGINPTIDQKLSKISSNLAHLKAIYKFDIIHLGSHSLPERTESERKRKKYLLLIISSWRSLRSEVKKIYSTSQNLENQSTAANVGTAVKTGLFAKGPFGLITAAAIVIVGALLVADYLLSPATITVKNIDCPPLSLNAYSINATPLLSVPDSPIMAGTEGQVTFPPLSVTTDLTPSSQRYTLYGKTFTHSLPRIEDITFDGKSLMNKKTTVELQKDQTHSVTLSCN